MVPLLWAAALIPCAALFLAAGRASRSRRVTVRLAAWVLAVAAAAGSVGVVAGCVSAVGHNQRLIKAGKHLLVRQHR